MQALLKPFVIALVAGPFVGAATAHREPLAYTDNQGLGTLCGAASPRQPEPTLLTVMAVVEASATYGEQTGRRMVCHAHDRGAESPSRVAG